MSHAYNKGFSYMLFLFVLQFHDCAYIKYKTTMLYSSLCNYTEVYILIKKTFIVISGSVGTAARQADERNKQAIFKNDTQIGDSIKEIKNR